MPADFRFRILVAIGDGGRPRDAVVIDWLDRRIWVGGRLAIKAGPSKFRDGASMPFVAVALVLCAIPFGAIGYADLVEALWGDDPEGGPFAPVNSIRAMLAAKPAAQLFRHLGIRLRANYRGGLSIEQLEGALAA